MCAYTNTHTMRMCVYMYVYMYVCVCVYMCAYTHTMCACVCVCVCVCSRHYFMKSTHYGKCFSSAGTICTHLILYNTVCSLTFFFFLVLVIPYRIEEWEISNDTKLVTVNRINEQEMDLNG